MNSEKELKRLHGIKSKYRGLSYMYDHKSRTHYWHFEFTHQGKKAQKTFPFTDKGERDAAIMYDKKLLEYGREPVNILKRK